MGGVRTGDDSPVRTTDTGGRGQKIAEGLDPDQGCEWVCAAVPGHTVETTWDDKRGSISHFP